MERPGFMIWHEDGKMLRAAQDQTLAAIFRAIYDYSTTGEIVNLQLSEIEKALYESLLQKIDRDARKYDETKRDRTIKGLTSAIQREYKAKGVTLSKSDARALAEQTFEDRYSSQPQSTPVNRSQHQSTIVNYSQPTERSEAERIQSVTPTKTLPVSQTISITTTTDQWLEVLRKAQEKGISANNSQSAIRLRTDIQEQGYKKVLALLDNKDYVKGLK